MSAPEVEEVMYHVLESKPLIVVTECPQQYFVLQDSTELISEAPVYLRRMHIKQSVHPETVDTARATSLAHCLDFRLVWV